MKKLVILGVLLISACGTVETPQSSSTTAHTMRTAHIPSTEIRNSCPTRDGGILPDPSCTPGVADPHVTQANIHTTICIPGYSKTVRPPVSLTDSWKSDDKRREGYPANAVGEEDHLISIELGGAPAERRNLWFEPGKIPNPKDSVENKLHREVCADKLPLSKAQHEISSNWNTAK